jgi:IS30 family transposase
MTAPFQSKLIPHEDFIREARAKRWSYPRIAKALLDTHGVKAAPSTIFHFVKVRARKKRLIKLPPSSRQITQTSVNPTSADGFFEPAPATISHEIRKPKYNINL